MEKPVSIVYDPKSDTWAAENPVNVYPGVTRIVWTIALVDDKDGDIQFGVDDDFQGITFAAGWPGTPPKGDRKTWSSTLADTMKPTDSPLVFEYTVNSLYRSDRAQVAVRKSWDPEVEEGGDPPPIKHG